MWPPGGPTQRFFFSPTLSYHSHFSINMSPFTCLLTATLWKRIGHRFPLLTPPPPPPCTASALSYKWVSGLVARSLHRCLAVVALTWRANPAVNSPTAAMATDVGDCLPSPHGNRNSCQVKTETEAVKQAWEGSLALPLSCLYYRACDYSATTVLKLRGMTVYLLSFKLIILKIIIHLNHYILSPHPL